MRKPRTKADWQRQARALNEVVGRQSDELGRFSRDLRAARDKGLADQKTIAERDQHIQELHDVISAARLLVRLDSRAIASMTAEFLSVIEKARPPVATPSPTVAATATVGSIFASLVSTTRGIVFPPVSP